MKTLMQVLIIFVLLGWLSACNLPFSGQAHSSKESHTDAAQAEPAQAESATSEADTAESESPPASLIEDLKTVLATESGVASSNVFVKKATAVEWNDSCLGAARPDEMCAQVITPGYQIVLGTLTQEFEFHTDRTGRHFRRVESKRQGAELPEPIQPNVGADADE
jgi:hypothetical protein